MNHHPHEIIGSNFAARYWDDADEAVNESATQECFNNVDEYTKSVGPFKPLYV